MPPESFQVFTLLTAIFIHLEGVSSPLMHVMTPDLPKSITGTIG